MYAVHLKLPGTSQPFYYRQFYSPDVRAHWIKRMCSIYKCNAETSIVTGL